MSKTAMKESFFSPRQLVPMVLGTLLYAAFTIPFNVFRMPGATGAVAIRPTVAIPMLFGIVFGPLTGFVVGLVGNTLSDIVSFGGIFWNWEIGSGLLGAIPGVAYFVMKRNEWTKPRGLAITVVLAIVASVVGIGFAVIADYILQVGSASADSSLAEFYFFAGNYALNGAILAPILLYAYARATYGHARNRLR
jgi:energy-coupling factor transport system substrate-specific component